MPQKQHLGDANIGKNLILDTITLKNIFWTFSKRLQGKGS